MGVPRELRSVETEQTSTVQVLSAGMLSVALETIADDDIVNAAEHGLGFAISGTVTTGGSVAVDGASVTVEVGATELTATTASDGTWSVNVGSDASYVVEPSVAVTVVATKTGHTDASEVTRPLAVDLTAPSSPSYTAPSSLRVGVAIGSLSPSSTSDTDIASYDAAGLPAGLVIAAVTGVISGTPSEAKATEDDGDGDGNRRCGEYDGGGGHVPGGVERRSGAERVQLQLVECDLR